MAVANTYSTRTTTRPLGSLIILSVTILVIIALVIAGVCVKLWADETTTRIVLITLISTVSIIGIISLIILGTYKRRKTKRIATNGRSSTGHLATNYTVAPTAPPLSDRTSSDYKKSQSNRSTLEA